MALAHHTDQNEINEQHAGSSYWEAQSSLNSAWQVPIHLLQIQVNGMET